MCSSRAPNPKQTEKEARRQQHRERQRIRKAARRQRESDMNWAQEALRQRKQATPRRASSRRWRETVIQMHALRAAGSSIATTLAWLVGITTLLCALPATTAPQRFCKSLQPACA